MKINYSNESNQKTEQVQQNTLDLTELYLQLQEQHRNVFMIKIEDHVFFYRTLGRSEWRNIISQEELNDVEKQDVICQVCTLYPENFDFEECSAGLPDVLHKKILENSLLDSPESQKNVLSYYRKEMFELDNQITCIINEAFPQHDIEEIDAWDVEKTTKYLSRAEWKLHNLRGIPFVNNESPEYDIPTGTQAAPAEKKESTIRGGEKSNKLTPEKLEEMKRMQEKYPEINFFADTILNEGVEGMADNVDTLAPALRPGF